jgi:hypothetical protein
MQEIIPACLFKNKRTINKYGNNAQLVFIILFPLIFIFHFNKQNKRNCNVTNLLRLKQISFLLHRELLLKYLSTKKNLI